MDYYIAKKDNDYYLPVFGSKQVESSDYTVLNTVEYKTPGNYTWTCPSGVTHVKIIISGGGGGGGGGYDWGKSETTYASSGCYGENGKPGQKIEQIISVVPGTTYTIVVGSGGKAGVTTHNSASSGHGTSGGNGGTSSFGKYTAKGGSGGEGGGYDDDSGG